MNLFHMPPWRPTPPPERQSQTRSVYDSINRANCASDRAEEISRAVDQQNAKNDLFDIERELLEDEWRRKHPDA